MWKFQYIGISWSPTTVPVRNCETRTVFGTMNKPKCFNTKLRYEYTDSFQVTLASDFIDIQYSWPRDTLKSFACDSYIIKGGK